LTTAYLASSNIYFISIILVNKDYHKDYDVKIARANLPPCTVLVCVRMLRRH